MQAQRHLHHIGRRLARARWLRLVALVVIVAAWILVTGTIALDYFGDLGSAAYETSARGTVVANTGWTGGYFSKRGNVTRHACILRYRYTVGAKTYEASEGGSQNGWIAGEPITVYYDARDPSRSTLEGFEGRANHRQGFLFVSGLGFVFVLFAVWANRRRSKRSAGVP